MNFSPLLLPSIQGLLTKPLIFNFACYINEYVIRPEDVRRCMMSFFNFARQITGIREAISGAEQRSAFDLEVNAVVLRQLQGWTSAMRPRFVWENIS